MISEWKMNLGHVIFWYMANTHVRGSSLPYGMPLTKIFQKFKVDFKNEECLLTPSRFDSGTLKKMGIDIGPHEQY